jgi:hypothetical protein
MCAALMVELNANLFAGSRPAHSEIELRSLAYLIGYNEDSEQIMKNTKFVVKVNRGGSLKPEYVRRIDRSPIQMTSDRKLALLMGRLTAEDAVRSIQTIRCSPELVSVQVSA